MSEVVLDELREKLRTKLKLPEQSIDEIEAQEAQLTRLRRTLERKIDEQVRGSLFQNQREFYLQEQLRAIHRELGDAAQTVAAGLRARAVGVVQLHRAVAAASCRAHDHGALRRRGHLHR